MSAKRILRFAFGKRKSADQEDSGDSLQEQTAPEKNAKIFFRLDFDQ